MRLLVLTQKVDAKDDVLGFFHEWLRRLGETSERVETVCLEEGVHDLPANVRVYSLGKERGASTIAYLFNFYRLIFSLQYDAVLVHMNPEYLVLGGWWWRLRRVRTVLWYTHRNVDLKLRIAVAFANTVATAARESLRVQSPKVKVIGHGIDTARFARVPKPFSHTPRIVSVGRLTPIKHLEVIMDAVFALRRRGIQATLTLIGEPVVATDMAYAARLREQVVHDPEGVVFAGAIPYDRMPDALKEYDLAINACPTGGIDKAVLESMAAGIPALVANRAFEPYLGAYARELMFAFGDAQDLAQKIEALFKHTGTDLQEFVQESARKSADVSTVVKKLVTLLS